MVWGVSVPAEEGVVWGMGGRLRACGFTWVPAGRPDGVGAGAGNLPTKLGLMWTFLPPPPWLSTWFVDAP